MTILKLMYKIYIYFVVYVLIYSSDQLCILYVATGGFSDFSKCKYWYGRLEGMIHVFFQY